MSYRVRYTLPDGRTGHWMRYYATRKDAQRAVDERRADKGIAYAVEEVHDGPEPKPEPTSTTERLVGLIRDRHAKCLAKYWTTLDCGDLTPEQWAQHAIEEALDMAGYLMRLKDGFAPEPGSMAAHHFEILRERIKALEEVQKAMSQDLTLAIQLGDALRQAMRTGEWRPGNDAGMASNAIAGWDRFRPSLGKAPSASEAPGDGGDSDRRRLEALERYLEGDTFREVWKTSMGPFAAGTKIEGQHFDAPTLAALADKLAEKETKP